MGGFRMLLVIVLIVPGILALVKHPSKRPEKKSTSIRSAIPDNGLSFHLLE
jgi:hypothetical protein